MTDDELSVREAVFVNGMLSGMSKRRAAMTATGCTLASADVVADRMSKREHVAAAIRAGRAAARAKAHLDRAALIRRLEDALNADPLLFVGQPLASVPPHLRRWLQKIKTTIKADFSVETTYELVNKSVITKQLADLHGWKAATKLDVTVADPAELAMPNGDVSWRDALSDDELATWGHATVTGNTREAKRLRALADDRLDTAVTRLRAEDTGEQDNRNSH